MLLDLAAPVLSAVRRAGDESGTHDLIRLVDVLITATRRRGAAQRSAPVHPG